MPTIVSLKCSHQVCRDGKWVKCDLPLTVTSRGKTHVLFHCSDGHGKSYTKQWINRLESVKLGGQKYPTP